MIRRLLCALLGHDLRHADTVVTPTKLTTRCRRCGHVLQTPEV